MVFYGVLDLLAKPVYCFIHVISVSKLDYNRLGFSSGKYSDGVDARLLNEKNGAYSAAATPRASMAPSPHGAAPAWVPGSNTNNTSSASTPANPDFHHTNHVVESA